jgi:hypothetical protein
MSVAWTTRSAMNRIRNWRRWPPVLEAALPEGAGVFFVTGLRCTPVPPALPYARVERGAVLEPGCETASCACVGLDERGRRAAGVGVGGGVFGRVEDAVRPRKAMPCRCTMRYSDESPIPNRSRISEVGVLVPPYRRAISSASSLLSRRRRRLSSDREKLRGPPWTPSTETACAGSTILNGFSFSSDNTVR